MENYVLEERLDLIEFRQELLFEDSIVSRLFFEYKVTRPQYKAITVLMDNYRNLIFAGKKVNHHTFEQEIYDITQHKYPDYHFVEYVVQGFHKMGNWEEVFETLYGDMIKYQYYMKHKDEEIS